MTTMKDASDESRKIYEPDLRTIQEKLSKQLAALKAENAAITAARDLALASLCKQDAEIDALKAERDALREFADLMGWTDEMIQREVAITRAALAKEPT